MEIRIAGIERSLLEKVREDAKKNMRTIGRQAQFIIQAYYDEQDKKGQVKEPLKISKETPESFKGNSDGAWRFEESQ